MSGCWVLVCGPSGAGKDSVIAWAREALAPYKHICFAPRLVTRPSLAGSEHEEISPGTMQGLRERGALAWEWQAHGHQYAIRAEYARRVEAGEVVVVNGSREHAGSLAGRRDVRCVLVTAPPAVVQQRLLARGREPAAAVSRRMARNGALPQLRADHVIHNDAGLEAAGSALRDYLLEMTR